MTQQATETTTPQPKANGASTAEKTAALALRKTEAEILATLPPEAMRFEIMQRKAKAYASSTMVPQQYLGNVGNCMIAIDLSDRIGASPLAVMQNMVPIHGNPAWSSKFLIGTVNASKRFTPLRFRYQGKEGTMEWGCRAYAKDKDTGEECVGSLITLGMAKEEGWSTKNGSKWKTMPEQMLAYRAAAFWTRLYAPDISLGMTTEEAEDIGPRNVPDIIANAPASDLDAKLADDKATDAPVKHDADGVVIEGEILDREPGSDDQ